MEKITGNIYRIDVPLAGSPLKNLNAYYIKGEDRSLLIDTGFNRSECREALFRGLEELGAELDRTDVFVTHLHSDHSGLAPELQRGDTKVYINEKDLKYLVIEKTAETWKENDLLYRREGFSDEQLRILALKNPARAYAPGKTCVFTSISDGDILRYGGHELRCVATGGHTPGHTCLYIESEKLMFLADHVLFDITPNITVWDDVENSLKDYFDSLVKIKGYDVAVPLPGHRTVTCGLNERIDQILEHHRLRLREAYDAVCSNKGWNSYEIASVMTWRIRCECWDEFPLIQKWFAVGEVIAHMDYLRAEGKVARALENGAYRYSAT